MNELSKPVSGLRKLVILGNVYYLGSADILYIEWTHLSPSWSKENWKKRIPASLHFCEAGALCVDWHEGSSSLTAQSFAVLWCTECMGSLIVSLPSHFNGRGRLVSGPSISMIKLFPLRAYFHWPDRVFPFTP